MTIALFIKKIILKAGAFAPLFFAMALGPEFAHSQSLTHPFALNKALIQRIKKRGRGFVSDSVGKYMLRAVEMADDKKYDQAIELLKWHYDKGKLSPTEKAKLALYMARFYRQNKDYKKSAQWMKKALSLKALNLPDHLSVLFGLAQSYAQEEDYSQAMRYIKSWFSLNKKPSPQAYILLARCYYGKNMLAQALKYAEYALSLIDRPKASWLLFASSLHIKEERYKKALPYLESLVALYPGKASHWKPLAGAYLHLEQYGPALVTLSLMDKMGHLKDKMEYINLAVLYFQRGQPYQSAELLRRQIEAQAAPSEKFDLEFIAMAYWIAREPKSALMYFKRASQQARKASFFIRYGSLLLDQELWGEAEQAFKKALSAQEIQEGLSRWFNDNKDQNKGAGKAQWLKAMQILTNRPGGFKEKQAEAEGEGLKTKRDGGTAFLKKASFKASSAKGLELAQGELNRAKTPGDEERQKPSSSKPAILDKPQEKTGFDLSGAHEGLKLTAGQGLNNKAKRESSQAQGMVKAPMAIHLAEDYSHEFSTSSKAKASQEIKLKKQLVSQLKNIYFGLGLSVYKQKKYDLALIWFKKIIEIDSGFLPAYQWIDRIEESLLKNQELN